jgi:hypothetical protein
MRWALLACLAALVAPAAAHADPVSDWNAIASTAIVTTAGQSAHASSLSYAMVQGAVYDAVNAIDRAHRPYLVSPPARRSDSKEAAVATAAYRVLAALFPAQQATLQPRYDAALAAIPDGRRKAGGIAAGEAAAAAMLADRAGDGRGAPFTVVLGTEPGVWRPTPPTLALDPAPWVGNVRPFVVPHVVILRSDPPNRLTSGAYARDLNEVKQVGSLVSTARTADQTEAAIFWQDHPLLTWNRVLQAVAATYRLDVATSARLFAAVNLAAADAVIGCWHSKYLWNYWRPVTAIREASNDGNPATVGDPGWLPLFDPSTPQFGPPLTTPPFPDHPSGHGCASGAVLESLERFFGSDRIPLTITSARTRTTRHFPRLSDALEEIVDARVWAGVHFRTADEDGAEVGERAAQWVDRHALRRLR